MTTLAQAVTQIVSDSVDMDGQDVGTIPFYNREILELLAARGITRKTEKAQQTLIEAYWAMVGQCFYKLVK